MEAGALNNVLQIFSPELLIISSTGLLALAPDFRLLPEFSFFASLGKGEKSMFTDEEIGK